MPELRRAGQPRRAILRVLRIGDQRSSYSASIHPIATGVDAPSASY
ncbi:MAG: hypothetical protein WB778_02035 [Thermoplasmata archaeon]